MKASRNWLVWTTLVLCAALVLGAMGWLTQRALDSERERSGAEAKADLEERTRLALWRMDAEGAAILLGENRLSSRGYSDLVDDNPAVKLRFESSGTGVLRSKGSVQALGELGALFQKHPLPLEGGELLRCVLEKSEETWQAMPKDAADDKMQNLDLRNTWGSSKARSAPTYQSGFNKAEKAQRAKVVDQTVANGYLQQEAAPQADRTDALQVPESVDTGTMRAVWIGGELFLLRQLSVSTPLLPSSGVRVQGAWLDAETVRLRLLDEITDLLPAATLVALPGLPDFSNPGANDPLALVSFPFRLETHELPQALAAPLGGPLRAGWIAVIVAIAAVALLVRGILRLSERRASFVSAVTHELRTPLTTFQLYSDMLQSGAVKEEKRGDYFKTLHREAGRLSHLVENVLAFSRIERGSARAAPRETGAGGLVQPMLERFGDRLQEAGLQLEVDLEESAWQSKVRADPAAVEHVLFNLFDNAAKYAAGSSPAQVRLTAEVRGSFLAVMVADHGPGIPAREAGRVFHAFHKSAAAAAESRPGVGLGLALSRRLARAGGGDLKLEESDGGCRFVLTLPLARG
ncbi:sensor histidine kinase [Luteolibacter marinus]|uniref:sensor histidine kinase n=1 Tax=Luteolibacter marinus TaxID=2776705 RepID=UPI0018664300|nr:HAMP domain-containing sensor histidine kinase [Luteolibacter marinus]